MLDFFLRGFTSRKKEARIVCVCHPNTVKLISLNDMPFMKNNFFFYVLDIKLSLKFERGKW